MDYRIALFLPSLRGGGAERSMLKLAAAIAGQGYPVDLVLAKAVGPYLKQVPPNVRVVDLGCKHVMMSLPWLIRYLRRERPYGVISALGHANLIALWARSLARIGSRVIVSDRGLHNVRVILSDRNSHGRYKSATFRGAVCRVLMRWFYPWADGIVAVSEGVAETTVEAVRLPRDRIQVIYNPIITDEMLAMSLKPSDHPWLQPGQPPLVLSAGRLVPEKDHVTLIKAFAQVGVGLPDEQKPRLMILGEGVMRATLERYVSELGLEDRVALPGFWSNPYPVMRACSVFVLPSVYEGLPGVLIEALACGTPVISTLSKGGAREILRDGEFGRMVPVGDVYAMTQAIEATLEERRLPAPLYELDRFRPEPVVEQYLALMGLGETGEQAGIAA